MKKILAVVLVLTFSMTGCNLGTIITDITKFIPVIVDILQVVSMETGKNTTDIQAKVANDANLVLTLVKAYEANQTNGSIWSDMNAAFATFEQDSAEVFQLAQVGNSNSQAKVSLMVVTAQTLLAIIETLIPAPPAGVADTRSSKFKASLPATKLTLGQVATNWNSVVAVKTGNVAEDEATAKMKIYVHP